MTRRFVRALGVWAIGVLVLLVVLQALASAEPLSVTMALRWAALALTIATFAAGIAAGDAHAPGQRAVSGVLVALLATGATVFVLHGWIAPAFDPRIEPVALTLTELLSRAEPAERVARIQVAWWIWQPFVTAATCLAFGVTGAMYGAWTRRAISPPVRQLLRWIAGFILITANYLVTENTYELVALRLTEPLPAIALLPLVFPASLALGMALPTWLAWRTESRRA